MKKVNTKAPAATIVETKNAKFIPSSIDCVSIWSFNALSPSAVDGTVSDALPLVVCLPIPCVLS